MKIKILIIATPMATLLATVSAGAAYASGVPLRHSHDFGRPHVQHVGPVSARTSANSSANANSLSNSRSTSGASAISGGGTGVGVGSQGQSLSVDSHATYEAQRRNPVSPAVAPPIVSSNDTCMGSTSIGGSAVSFGFSAGTTWTDDNCVMLKNSREMWNMGFKGAALARLCMDQLNREAFEATGINCPPRRQSEGANGGSNGVSAAGGNTRVNDFYRY